MPTVYPGSLDTLTNPTAADTLAAVPHDEQHADANDAIEAIETKLGTGASTPTTSGHFLKVTGAGATAYQAHGLTASDVGAATSGHDHAASYEAAGTVTAHAADTTAVHGIADTSVLATTTDVSTAVSSHAGAADPHTGYQKESEKGVANGYASLGAGGLVPMSQLATGTPDGTKFVRDDGTLAAPSSAGIGAWTAFTPTWTLTTSGTTTLGDGTLTGFHKDLDAESCLFTISLVWGSTTTVSTGNAWEFALPHTASAHLQMVAGYILDSGTAYFTASGKIAASATRVTPIIAADSTPARLLNNTNPMSWAAGDELVITGILRR